jgi:hypothetical protein
MVAVQQPENETSNLLIEIALKQGLVVSRNQGQQLISQCSTMEDSENGDSFSSSSSSSGEEN